MVHQLTRAQLLYALAASTAVCAVLLIIQAPAWAFFAAAGLVGLPWMVIATNPPPSNDTEADQSGVSTGAARR